ncbi:hypothetical protein IY145_00620 [Methylosinus sp. H3A]|uniref:hypothetical protein n=1 Tax=Methylosinus sp. H3A TaxID=2785786 RepID=UPI0018C2583F|nr:hypothetical protein [Methylosinus sp. H3A]MBG0807935.1 hypothetical protein [Methylosinus sp. H3A]
MIYHIKPHWERVDQFIFDGSKFYIADMHATIGDRAIVASGIDARPDVAVAKAESELAERVAYLRPPIILGKTEWRFLGDKITMFVCSDRKPRALLPLTNLNGSVYVYGKGLLRKSHAFAAHLSRELAAKNARTEFIERHLNKLIRMHSIKRLKLEDPHGSSWIYHDKGLNYWHVLSHVTINKISAWGSAASDVSVDDARQKAQLEACMMALSKIDYGVRGNSINEYQGEINGQSPWSIEVIEHEPIIVNDSTRFVFQALGVSR